MYRLASIFLMALWFAGPLVAEIYKWIDAEGQVHYGERPPAGSNHLEVRPSRGPSDESAEQSRKRWQGLIEQQERAARLRKEDEAEAAEEKAAREAELKSACARARGRLSLYKEQVRVFRRDEQGQRVYLDDEQRAREMAELESYTQKHCR